MEWIFFAIGVAVIGVVGIALGLVLGRAVARRAARREGESSAFMTPVGPPAGEGADADDAAAIQPDAPAGDADGDRHD